MTTPPAGIGLRTKRSNGAVIIKEYSWYYFYIESFTEFRISQGNKNHQVPNVERARKNGRNVPILLPNLEVRKQYHGIQLVQHNVANQFFLTQLCGK